MRKIKIHLFFFVLLLKVYNYFLIYRKVYIINIYNLMDVKISIYP